MHMLTASQKSMGFTKAESWRDHIFVGFFLARRGIEIKAKLKKKGSTKYF